MRVAAYSSVHDIPAEAWDDTAPADFFFQRSFLKVMEESAVESARYRFLILRHGDRTAGLAVLSMFTLKLDLLSNDPWIRRLRLLRPTLLDVPIVCCGVPASYGQHHLHVKIPALAGEAVHEVHRFMDGWAAEERCSMLFWKEWNPSQPPYLAIGREGYVPLPTLADHRLQHLDSDTGGFLRRLRSPYRRKYRSAAAVMRGPGPVWCAGPLRVEVTTFESADAAGFHHGYHRVMERTPVRLETYPAAFFHSLAGSAMDTRLLRITHCEHRESLAALLYAADDVLTFALAAKERAHYHASLYTTMLQCIVLYAMQHGFHEVRLGQTSSYAKCSIGSLPWRLETFIRMRKPWQHSILGVLGGSLFPEVPEPRLRVFSEPGGVSEEACARAG